MEQHPYQPGHLLDYLKTTFLNKVVTASRSAAGNWLQFTLEKIEKGAATISLPIRPEMANPFGMIHGGMMALAIDEAIGWAVVSLESPTFYTSVNLQVDFLYAIKVGERMLVSAAVVRHGKKMMYVKSEVHHENGTLLATATSHLVVTSMQATMPNN